MRKPHPAAKKLRKEMPPAEQKLWARIRRKQLGGFRFRRQHTVGAYIADFACLDAKLIIELDGDQHGRGEAPAQDARRDEFLREQGFDVLRFWNNAVHGEIDSVLEAILNAAVNSVRAQQSESDAP